MLHQKLLKHEDRKASLSTSQRHQKISKGNKLLPSEEILRRIEHVCSLEQQRQAG